MKKPNFLKTRKEKNLDIAVSIIELGISLNKFRENQELKQLERERIELENENLRLNNQLLELKKKD